MIRFGYCLLLLIGIAPILPGMMGVMLSSLGYIPAVGLHEFSVAGFADVWRWTGVGQSLLLSAGSALLSTYGALLLSFAVLMTLWSRQRWHWVEHCLSGLLALPHVAFAIGFAFLFAPTGMMARAFVALFDYQVSTQDSAWLVHDPHAFGLTLALALKETPFLLLMSIPVLQQLHVQTLLTSGASLGYSPMQSWWKLVLPQWLRKMRFALFAVIAYSVSVVDVSLILGPTTPPTFAVLVWQWFSDPDLNQLPRAAAGAVVLLGLAGLMLLLVVLIEALILRVFRGWLSSGRHGMSLPGKSVMTLVLSCAAIIFPLMLVWSVSQRWRFPSLWPSQFSDRFWLSEWPNMLPTLSQSLWIALLSGTLALLLGVIAHEFRTRSRLALPAWVIVLPMLLPQISLLFGLQIATLFIAAEHYTLWVIWSHVFFAFPLVYLALDGPWKSYNPNYTRVALSLGKTPWQLFWQIKVPMLLPGLLYAWAVGVSVSLAQYLPTLMLGGGRIATITTEAVALSSGYDRRVMAIYALWQALLPFIFFSLAVVISRVQIRRHRSVQPQVILHDLLPRKPHHP
ncbi:thiamine ABC transporter permease [Vibrio furnissii]|uniref:ABC transporter permease n=1 Tax=Vibrio furnissii TaxID=29494 RepID=UPI0013025C46|nr:thiamine ABC transporter permease [Vibrio furnissii]MCG6212267.1 thiamine ABC transporter permease [Vibrio furnissii]